MKEPKFTTGPWRFTSVDYGPKCIGYVEGENFPFGAIWSDGAGKPVCVAQDASSYRANFDFMNEQDAHLISAAPELYALLAELIDIEGPQPGTSTWFEKVKSVLAKARGETP